MNSDNDYYNAQLTGANKPDFTKQAVANVVSIDAAFAAKGVGAGQAGANTWFLKQDDALFHNLYVEKTSLEYLFFTGKSVFEALVIEDDRHHAKDI